MTSLQHPTTFRRRSALILAGSIAALLGSHSAQAATKIHINNTTDLNAAGAWTGGVPGTGDIALWDFVTTSTGATAALGGNLSVLGVQITDPSASITISAGNTLTLGTSGIDMSLASNTTNDLTISSGLTIGAGNQVWNVATGRTLTLNSGTFTRTAGATLNLQGAGTVATTNIFNNAQGIMGTWASFGTGASTQYATVSGSSIVGLTGTAAADGSGLTDTTGLVNYDLATFGGTVPATVSANTIRYTGATGTTAPGATSFTVNGLMNVGTGLWTIGPGTLTIGADLELVVNSANNAIAISSVIANNGVTASALTATGGNTLTLSAANTYTGATRVTNGTLKITNSAGLGTTAGTTTVSSGGTLEIAVAGAPTISEPLVLNGAGVGGTSGALLIDNSVTLNGAINLASASTINVGGGQTLTLSTFATFTGAGNLTKTGTGTISASAGTGGNTGTLTVNAGTFTVNAASARWNAGNITVNTGGTFQNTGTGTNSIVDTVSLTVNSGGILSTQQAGNETVTMLTLNGGSWLNNSTNTGFTMTFTSGISLTADSFIGNTNTAGTGTLSTGSIISSTGAFGLTKVGNSTVTLSGANTYTGATNGSNGTLSLTGSLTGSNVTTSGSGIISESAAGFIAGTGVTFTQGSSGTSTLAGLNTYTGATIVNGGVLLLDLSTNTAGVLDASSALTLGGGQLTVQGKNAAVTSSQMLGNVSLTAGQASAIKVDRQATGTGTTLNVGTITRVAGSSLFIDLSSQTTGNTLHTTTSGAAQSATSTLLPFTAITDSTSRGFATIDASGNIVRYTAARALTGAGLDSVTTVATTSDTNYLVSTSTPVTHANSNWAVNSLELNDSLNIGGGVLSVTSGNVFRSGGNATTISNGQLGDSGTELFMAFRSSNNNLIIASTAKITGGSTDTTGSLTFQQALGGGSNGMLDIATDNMPQGLFTIQAAPGATAEVVIGGSSSTAGVPAAGTTGSINGNVANYGILHFNRSNLYTYSGVISGTGSVQQNGSSTLTFDHANSYTGGTFILGGGTLKIGVENALPTTGTVNFGNAGTTIGALDLTDFSQTIGSLTVTSNNTSANTITIGSGKTLTTTANVTIGQNTQAGSKTNLTVTGAGTWAVSSSGGTFQIGGYTGSGTSTNENAATLDLSGLSVFTLDLGNTGTALASSLHVGSTATNGQGGQPYRQMMILAPTSTITARQILIGDSGAPTANGNPDVLKLSATGVNTLNTDQLAVGSQFTAGTDRSAASLVFAGSGAGSLILRGSTGGVSRALFNIGTGGGTGTAITNSVDLTGHNADLMVSTLTINSSDRTLGQTNTFSFNTGTLDVTTINLARKNVSNAVTYTTTVNLGGGTVTVGTGGIKLLENTSAATAGTNNSTLNITGGVVSLGGDIRVILTGAAAHNATLNLNGGTLDMSGFNIGGAGALIDTLTFASGTLKNVNQINDGAGLTKTTINTLILDGTNSYTGPTSVVGGTLAISGSISATASVSMTGGSLMLGASNVVNNAADVTFGTGGKLDSGGFSEFVGSGDGIGANGTGAGLGALTLSGDSTIDLGASATNSILWFSGLGTITPGKVLTIDNWSGNASPTGGGIDQLRFTSDPAALLSQITFTGFSGVTEISFSNPGGASYYEIVPIPEPSSTALVSGAALLALIGFREWRRLLGSKRA